MSINIERCPECGKWKITYIVDGTDDWTDYDTTDGSDNITDEICECKEED